MIRRDDQLTRHVSLIHMKLAIRIPQNIAVRDLECFEICIIALHLWRQFVLISEYDNDCCIISLPTPNLISSTYWFQNYAVNRGKAQFVLDYKMPLPRTPNEASTRTLNSIRAPESARHPDHFYNWKQFYKR